MPAMSLNHYTINARDLEATKKFYTDVVGLAVGDRPPLDFPGYWLYCGGVPTVHLVGPRPENESISDAADFHEAHRPSGYPTRRSEANAPRLWGPDAAEAEVSGSVVTEVEAETERSGLV